MSSLSNTTLQILAGSPYWDDFDESKAFLRMLFRPGMAVQTRELTQSQTLLQAQLGRLGSALFHDGESVVGAQLTLANTAVTLRLQPTYGGSNVDLSILTTNATSSVIVQGSNSLASGRVVSAVPSSDSALSLVVLPIGSGTFQANEILTYEIQGGGPDIAFAQITTPNNTPLSPACVASIDSGIVFVEGFFLDIPAQTCVVSANTSIPTARIGLNVTETIVTEYDDLSLVDPAIGALNYGAPGAHRLRLDLSLVAYNLTASDLLLSDVTTTGNFIELLRLVGGVASQKIAKNAKGPVGSTATTRDNYIDAPFLLGLTDFTTTLTGTVATVANTSLVVGTQTAFTVQIAPGDTITIANTVNTVDAVANDTALYTATNWTSTTTGLTAKASRPTSLTALLGAGKAVLEGAPFETFGTSSVEIPRARTLGSVVNQVVPLTLGNYTTVDTLTGIFNLSTYETVDLHCVTIANINAASSGVYTPTKIGTATIRNLVPNGASANGTYSYKLYPSNFAFTTVTGNVASGSNSSTGSISLDTSSANVANAYLSAHLSLTDTNGNTASYPVTAYTVNASGRFASVNVAVGSVTVNTSTTYRVSFGSGQIQSVVTTNSSALLKSSQISPIGQQNGQTLFTSLDKKPLIYPMPQRYPQPGTTTSASYDYDIVLTGTHSSNTCVIQTPNAACRFYPSTGYTYSATEIDTLFIITAANGTVLTAPGTIASITSDAPANTSVHSLTIHTLSTSTANLTITARVHVSPMTPRTKTFTGANTTVWANTTSNGQTQINSPNTTPGSATSLSVPDVVSVLKIVDSLSATDVTTAMLSNSSFDVTNNYILDSGQRDTLYDSARIILKPTAPPALGRLGVIFTRYAHAGTGPITVDSYSNVSYESIPTYSSPKTGLSYVLRDMIDFRPVRDLGASTISSVETPDPQSNFIGTYNFYLPRIDKIALTNDRQFVRIPGIAALPTLAPPDRDDALTIYTLSLPAYTISQREVTTTYIDHKRYSMSDINTIDKRLDTLESYTALNQLEQIARDTQLFDTYDLERFKNGILVDPLVGHGVGDVTRSDYFCAIDPIRHKLLPSFSSNQASLSLYSNTSANYRVSPDQTLAFINYNEAIAITQPAASQTLAVNPFNLTNFRGFLTLSPDGDTWYDTTVRPLVTNNFGGTNDDAESLPTTELFSTTWGDWQTRWAGQSVDLTQTFTPSFFIPSGKPDSVTGQVPRTLIDTTSELKKNGVTHTALMSPIQQTIGTRILDQSVIPFMRANTVLFIASGMKPNAILSAFLDGRDVTRFVERANELTLSGPSTVLWDLTHGAEKVTSSANGVGTVVGGFANTIYVVSDPLAGNGAFLYANGAPTPLLGSQSAQTVSVIRYTHWSGNILNANGTTVTLDTGASANLNFYTGLSLTLTTNAGAGASGVITAYNGSTKVATVVLSGAGLVSGGSTVVAPVGSRYSIGPLQTSNLYTTSQMAGCLVGALHLPAQSFYTGPKVFRLVDSPTNTPTEASTIAEAFYHAQGLIATPDAFSCSTRGPILHPIRTTQSQSVTTMSPSDRSGVSLTPLAQSILIDEIQYPEGLFVTSTDLFFATADASGLPVTLQIRPMVAGMPSAEIVLAESILPAGAIHTTTAPNVADPTTATTFLFPRPVHLRSNREYALVVLTASQDYTIYTAEIGSNRLGTHEKISTQPSVGALRIPETIPSQTTSSDQALVFVLRRAQFSANAATLATWATVTTNVVADSIYVNPGLLQFSNTAATWTLQTTNANNILQNLSAALTILPDKNTLLASRASLVASGNTMLLTGTFSTTNDAVSPVIDLRRTAITTVAYAIDNGGLNANAMIITAPGGGYAVSNTTLPVVITNATGSGANVYATTNSSGNIVGFIINTPGSGYVTSPTLTVNSANSSAASIVYLGEDTALSTQSSMRYLTRPVTLANGFDSADLIVNVGAYKPANTNIDVYCKVLSADDPATFDEKPWVPMVQSTDHQIVSGNPTDTHDYTYVTPNASAAYTTNNVTYTRFMQYAVKIILRSPNSTLVPCVTNVRVIALDS